MKLPVAFAVLALSAYSALAAPPIPELKPGTEPAPCLDRAKLLDQLSVGYGEALVGIGLQATGSTLEILTSPAGTFTVLITTIVDGKACTVIATVGKGWQVLLAGQPA
jgi:hypothetical protein